MIKPLDEATGPLVTELLLLPDGSVLADRLTPTLAALLEQIPLHPDARTQLSLRGCMTKAGEGWDFPLFLLQSV